MPVPATAHAERIRILNDNFRSTFIGGQVLLTCGVNELPIDVNGIVPGRAEAFGR